MINLGILSPVEGYTFAYSGNLQLGDNRYIVVAFETRLKSGSKFEIKMVESKEEMNVVISTFNQQEDNKVKRVESKSEIPWYELAKEIKPINKTPSLFG